jgi:hypothetical protein
MTSEREEAYDAYHDDSSSEDEVVAEFDVCLAGSLRDQI